MYGLALSYAERSPENILSVNLDLLVLEGIKVIDGMIGKNKTKKKNLTKQNISVLQMLVREAI